MYKTLGRVIKEVVNNTSQPKEYKSLSTAIKDIATGAAKKIERHKDDQIVAGTYRTKDFDASPEAQLYFTTIPKTVDANFVERSAQFHDKLYGLLKKVRVTGTADDNDVKTAEQYKTNIDLLKKRMPEAPDAKHLEKEVEEIKNYVGKEGSPLAVKPASETGEVGKDIDIDSSKFPVSRKSKMERKLKITDDD